MTKRIEQAMNETQTALARAMRYSPEFRDTALIAGYEAHIVKLVAMLDAGRVISPYHDDQGRVIGL